MVDLPDDEDFLLASRVATTEREAIKRALVHADFRRNAAAKLLGIQFTDVVLQTQGA